MQFLTLIAAWLGVVLCCGPAAAQTSKGVPGISPGKSTPATQPANTERGTESEPDGNTLITPHILFTEPITGPGSYTIGLRFTIEQDWYTYWQNNGSTGAPPYFEWTLPDGVRVGEPQWPVPERKIMQDGVDYVYHDEVTLLFPVEVSAGADLSEPAELYAEWLVCKHVCLPGSKTIEFGFDDPGNSEHTVVGNEASSAIDASRTQLPIADSASSGVLTEWADSSTLRVRARGAEQLVYLPGWIDNSSIYAVGLAESGMTKGDQLEITYHGDLSRVSSLPAVIGVEREGELVYYQFHLPTSE